MGAFTAAQAAQKISGIAVENSVVFTAAQAAQKTGPTTGPNPSKFTAAQAAQKALTSFKGAPDRFTAAQAAQKKARAYLETGGWTKVEDGLPGPCVPKNVCIERDGKRLVVRAAYPTRRHIQSQ